MVEIIEAYQPRACLALSRFNLQQQKLQKLTSHRLIEMIRLVIYNSRNYRSLLARKTLRKNLPDLQQQKLQKLTSLSFTSSMLFRDLQQQKLQKLTSQHIQDLIEELSTIVEIIEAYQPRMARESMSFYLQQQKLQKLTSPNSWSGSLR